MQNAECRIARANWRRPSGGVLAPGTQACARPQIQIVAQATGGATSVAHVLRRCNPERSNYQLSHPLLTASDKSRAILRDTRPARLDADVGRTKNQRSPQERKEEEKMRIKTTSTFIFGGRGALGATASLDSEARFAETA